MTRRRPKLKMLAPCECRMGDDALKLQRDNIEINGCSIILGETTVVLSGGSYGQPSDSCEIKIVDFNKLVRWWTKKQKVRK